MTTVDTSEKLDSQFIGFRGEIQSSRARLYPLSVNLGEVGGWMRTHIFVMFYLVLFYSVLFCFVLFRFGSFCFVLMLSMKDCIFRIRIHPSRFNFAVESRNRATHIPHRLLRSISSHYL